MTCVVKVEEDMLTYLQVLHPVFTCNPPALVPLEFFFGTFGIGIGAGYLFACVWVLAAVIDCVVLTRSCKRCEMPELHVKQRISSFN